MFAHQRKYNNAAATPTTTTTTTTTRGANNILHIMCINESNWKCRSGKLINMPFVVVPLLITFVHLMDLVSEVSDVDGDQADEEGEDGGSLRHC